MDGYPLQIRKEKHLKERNYGIDLLRMVAMFMVVVLHVQGHGGIIAASGVSIGHYGAIWLLEYAAYCAVDCYVLISGYVGADRDVKLSNLLNLWVQVAFYSVLLTLIVALCFPGTVGIQEGIKALFPVIKGQYWFFSAYVGMYLFVPFLNCGIRHLSQKAYGIVLLFGFFFLSVAPTILRADTFLLDDGYHTLWFVFLYVLGAYIKKYDFPLKRSKFAFIFVLVICIGWFERVVATYIAPRILFGNLVQITLFSYCAPTTLIAAVSLLKFFAGCRLSERAKNVIAKVSPLAFGVYLLHDHPLIRLKLISGRFAFFTQLPAWATVICTIVAALVIYLLCSIIEFFRQLIFAKLHVKEALMLLENKLCSRLRKDNAPKKLG